LKIFSDLVLSNRVDKEWARKSLACQTLLDALFLSAHQKQAVYLDNGVLRIATSEKKVANKEETVGTSTENNRGTVFIILAALFFVARSFIPKLGGQK